MTSFHTLTLAAALALVATTASAQTPPPAPSTTPQSSASEETRPAFTTFFGDTGLWFVPTAEVLPSGRWSASGYRRGTNFLQGYVNVGDFAGTFAFGQDMKAVEMKLIKMDKDWTAAELKGDKKAIDMYIADDFLGTTPEGMLQNKTQYMADIKATTDKDVADQYVIRFFGPDVAVMTHRGTVTGEKPLQYRSTHVWMNRGGKWMIVAHHSSEIGSAPGSPSAAKAATPMNQKRPKIAPMTATPAAVDAAPTKE